VLTRAKSPMMAADLVCKVRHARSSPCSCCSHFDGCVDVLAAVLQAPVELALSFAGLKLAEHSGAHVGLPQVYSEQPARDTLCITSNPKGISGVSDNQPASAPTSTTQYKLAGKDNP
jgi:hypothetical protein